MRMRYFLLLIGVMIVAIACTPRRYCTLFENYVTKVDTTKPYMLKGKYCIASMKDTIIEDNMGIISFNVYDRITGNVVKDGVVWFIGVDTVKVLFTDDKVFKKLPEGNYSVVVSDTYHLALKTENIKLYKHKKIDINFYLGNSLQW